MAAFFKSALWLLGSTALGYSLFILTTPDDEIVAEKHPETQTPEAYERRKIFLDVLQKAAENKNSMYRQTKEEIDEDIRNN